MGPDIKKLATFFLIMLVMMSTVFENAKGAIEPYKKGTAKACIFYDEYPAMPEYKLGEIYMIMMYNLLGHFRELNRVYFPLIRYNEGDLSQCDVAVYVGSHYFATRPEVFLKDFLAYQKPFLWINYGMWQLREYMLKNGLKEDDFIEKVGFKFNGLVRYDEDPLPPTQKDPGFYRNFLYKGKKFYKYGRYNEMMGQYISSPELTRMIVKDEKEVLAYAQHNKRPDDKLPYIVHHKNFMMVADIPFSFIHEVDRYMIFADVLFDWLGLPPRLDKKLAMIRLEDIHPEVNPDEIYRVTKIFASRQQKGEWGLPFTISTVTHFVDFANYEDGEICREIPLTKAPRMMKALKYAIANKARLIYHGFTHLDIENLENSVGCSGGGFEFWNPGSLAPLKTETPEGVEEKILSGEKIFKEANLWYDAWVTPHYQASRAAYHYFAKHFPRTIQRVRYFSLTGREDDPINWAGQIYPYTIEEDFYGQWVWPENLGNIQVKFRGVDSPFLHSVDQVFEAIDIHTVLRDSWGSFFWHSMLFPENDGNNSLKIVIDKLLEKNFEFIDIRLQRKIETCERYYWDKGQLDKAKLCSRMKK